MSLPYSLPPAFTNEPRQDLPLNNKDALIKRLNDVVLSLSKDPGTGLNDSTLTAIYSEVDHIEHLLNNEEKRPESNEGQDPEDLQTATNAEENLLQSSPALIKESRMSTETTPHSPNPPPWPAPSMTISRALEIANAAEELASQLTSSIEELQKRREESEVCTFIPNLNKYPLSGLTNETQHIHSLLISRAEKAAERIIYLESRISEM